MKPLRIMFTAVAIGVGLTACGTPAKAQVGKDVQCLLVSNLFSKAEKDPKARATAEVSKFFYLGRVYGRLDQAQLKTHMVAQQKLITKSNAASIMNNCARQMEAGIKMVQATTQQLTKAK